VTGYILIDFDNLLPPKVVLNASAVNHRLAACIRESLAQSPDVNDLNLRLYGGWKTESLLSRRGSDVAALMPEVDPFPMVLEKGRILRGSLRLATGLVSQPAFELDDTFRTRASPPRLRLSTTPVPEGCASAEHDRCPVRSFARMTSNPDRLCPGDDCAITARSAFTAYEQKMVDTMLTCDLVELASNGSAIVSVVSADTDFVPSLLYARSRSLSILQLQVPAAGLSPQYVRLLEENGIIVNALEGRDGDQRIAG